MQNEKNCKNYNISASTSDGPATTDAALAALAAEAGLIDPVQEPSGGLSFMVATDDGAGGDDKIDDSCNGNEATTAAALVSQMGAGEPMQVDGDGNFVLPQVDGPIDDLLSDDEEKMDLNEEPAPENAAESAEESAVVTQENVDTAENVHTEESALKEEQSTSENLPESIAATIAGGEASEETAGAVDNQLSGRSVDDDVPMETSVDDAELTGEKNLKDLDSSAEIKPTNSELPLVQSPAKAVPSEQTSLTDVANSAAETDGAEQNESSQATNIKIESYLVKSEKSPVPDIPTDHMDVDMSHLSQDETQETEKIKDEPVGLEAGFSGENSLKEEEDLNEPMLTDDGALPAADAVNVTPATVAPVIMPSIQMKLEPASESMEQDRLSDLPISPMNGVAAPLEKEAESAQKVHASMKIEMKDEIAVPKRENLKQEKINDRSETAGDDSTALTTLATAALGSAESPVKIKNEQVNLVNIC